MTTKPPQPNVQDILYKESGKSVGDVLDSVYSQSPSGQISSAISDSIYGINHLQQPGPISINKDVHGLTFFTRPMLNLTDDNIRSSRLFAPMLSKDSKSLPRVIRCTLDPRLARARQNLVDSPLVDRQQAFIPILTNHLISCAGWPDFEVLTYTSPDGVLGESFSMVDNKIREAMTYDLTCNFRNLPGDPITMMFLWWVFYQSRVYMGDMVPYPDALIQNEIDYNTRIYRLVLDSTKKYVQKIAATGAAFPITVPIGNAFNFQSDRPYNEETASQLTVNFRCMGALYQDPILIHQFNQTVYLHNDTMKDQYRSRYYVKISTEELSIFNMRGYPHIDERTYELQWWVSKEEYQLRLPYLAEKRRIESSARLQPPQQP